MLDYAALRLSSLRATVKPDHEAQLRRIFRTYSQKFHTPLHVVEELPVDYVVRHYFESEYSTLTEEEIEREIRELTTTEEELREERRRHDEEEAEAFDFATFSAEQERARLAEEARASKAESTAKQMKTMEIQQKVSALVGRSEVPAFADNLPEKKLPPNISMKFMDEAELESLIAQDSMSPPPKKKA